MCHSCLTLIHFGEGFLLSSVLRNMHALLKFGTELETLPSIQLIYHGRTCVQRESF